MAIPHDSWRRLACILFRQLVRKSSARRQPYLSIFVQPDEKAYSAIRTPERCGIAKKTEIVFNKYKARSCRRQLLALCERLRNGALFLILFSDNNSVPRRIIQAADGCRSSRKRRALLTLHWSFWRYRYPAWRADRLQIQAH